MVKGKKIRRKIGNIDYGILYCIIILLAIGIVMVYSASSYYAMFHFKDSAYFLKKEGLAAILGLIAMFVFMGIDYHKLKKATLPLMVITIPLLLAVYAFPATNGANRWIDLGPITFQPSELAKYVVVLFLALSLSTKGDGVKKFWTGIVPYICLLYTSPSPRD